MSKYKIGDKVILGEHTNKNNWTLLMDQYVGKTATLVRLHDYRRPIQWFVDIDNEMWSWEENCFNQCPCKKVKLCLKHRKI